MSDQKQKGRKDSWKNKKEHFLEGIGTVSIQQITNGLVYFHPVGWGQQMHLSTWHFPRALRRAAKKRSQK